MEQRTEEWFQSRLGKVTASRISDVIAKTKTGFSTSRQNYLVQLVSERLTGKKGDSYVNQYMLDGIEREPVAKELYEKLHNVTVTEVGFFDHPTIANSGASPDGAVNAEIEGKFAGLIEIKCPIETTHTNTLMSKTVPSKYIPQIQWQMASVGANVKWVDFISYNPNFPENLQLFVTRVERDDEYIASLEVEVKQFLEEVETTILKLKE
ncbi:exonuclease [bacterium]|nr:exonuclease [bacterium]